MAVDPASVEPFEVKPLSQGLDHFGLVSDGIAIAGVHRFDQSPQVLDHVEWGRVASLQEGPGAAAVFRRCPALSADTDRIASLRFLRESAFDADLMVPSVAEVILVEEALVAAELEVGEADLMGIQGEPGPARSADAVVPAVDAEAMQMGVAPAEGDLDDVMELSEGTLAADQDPPPDHGADLADPDVELVDGRNRRTGHDPSQRTQGRPQESAPGLARSPLTAEHRSRLGLFWADSKYHNHRLEGWLVETRAGYRIEVVSRPPGSRGYVKLPRRWIVERTFAWLG